MSRVGYLLPAMLLAGCALVNQLFPPEPLPNPSPEPPEGFSDAAVMLPSPESLAAGIALQDLIGQIRTDVAGLGGLAPDGGVREADDGGAGQDGGWLDIDVFLARCFMNPATYEVWVDKDPAKHFWRVVLFPKYPDPCTNDVIGGGGEYEIDASSFEILKRKQYE